jgi:hypothetical protein
MRPGRRLDLSGAILRRGAGGCKNLELHSAAPSKPNVAATAGLVTLPWWMLTPWRSAGYSAVARSSPLQASWSTYGGVTLVRAQVLVRPTAPGMLVVQ